MIEDNIKIHIHILEELICRDEVLLKKNLLNLIELLDEMETTDELINAIHGINDMVYNIQHLNKLYLYSKELLGDMDD